METRGTRSRRGTGRRSGRPPGGTGPFFAAALDSLTAHVAVLDPAGAIVAVNEAWRRFAGENGGERRACDVGANYVAASRSAADEDEYARRAADGVEAVLAGRESSFSLEYPCDGGGQARWFLLHASPLRGGQAGAVVSHVDITRRKLAEEEAARGASHVRQILNSLPVFVGVLTPEGILTEVNRTALDAAGLEPDDVLGVPFDQTYWWSHSEDARAGLREAIRRGARGEASRYDVEVRVGPDRRLTIEFTLAPMLDAEGRVTHLVPSGIDVTERKRTERELAESEARLRGTLENAAVGIAHVDLDSRWLRVNETFCRIFGYAPEDLAARTLADLTHPDDAGAEREDFARLVEGTGGEPLELRCVGRDGRPLWVQLTRSLQRDGRGRPQSVVAVVEDITPRKLAEAEFDRLLTRQQQRTRQLHRLATLSLEIHAAPTPEQVVRVATEAAREILGAEGAATHFEPQGRWSPPHGAASFAPGSGLSDAEGGGEEEFELASLVRQVNRPVRVGRSEPESSGRRPGTPAVRGWLAAPLVARDGRNLGLIRLANKSDGDFTRDDEAILVQIAQLTSAALEHLRSVEELRRASRTKSEFLAHASHEIRTPLGAILGMAQLALDEELPPTLRDCVQTINDSAASLMRLLNDVLDFSRIEAGALRLDRGRFGLRGVCEETVKSLAIGASTKGIELNCHLAPSLPEAVFGDAGRLRQILTNLVGNAIKFTERGEVVLRVRPVVEAAEDVTLQFTVADTGIGIASEARETIFTAFAQADETTTRRFGGTGLGLAICSQLLAQMGGRMWVDSELGRGSEFHFTLTFGRAADDAGGAAERRALRGLSVLVADDQPTTRRVLEDLLREAGAEVEVVEGAEPAAGLLAARGRPYDVVVIDARLPDGDGFALAERVRRSPGEGRAAVLTLTAVDRHAFAERLDRLEPIATVEKPVLRDDLVRTLAALHAGTHGPAPAPSANGNGAAHGPRRTLRILLAEDTSANRKVVTAILGKRGHEVVAAHDGGQAVELCRRGTFDLILMDVRMPSMDGFRATAAIRAWEREAGRRTPIVAMTAQAQQGDCQRCLDAGMDGYVVKPIDADELVRVVESYAEPCAPRPTAPRNGHDGGLVADFDAALTRMGGSRALLADMVGYFLEDAPGLLRQIRDTALRGETAEMQRAAHSLKGLAANFDARRAVEAAYAIEQGDATLLQHDPELLGRLEREVDRLQEALATYMSAARA